MSSAAAIPAATQLLAGLVCVLAGVTAYLIRENQARRHRVRLMQLQKSAELLRLYAHNLDAFLSDPVAPVPLKRVAMQFAAFTDDRAAVLEFASWMSAQPIGNSVSDGDTLEILQAVDRLHSEQPHLARAFQSALICGGFGAILRWPESARFFDLSPAMVADGTKEVAAAVRASRMRQQPFLDLGLSQSLPVAC